jgi:carboxyl-terminal processing protease
MKLPIDFPKGRCLATWLLTLFFFLSPGFASVAPLAPSKDFANQSVAIIRALERQHYTGKRMDKAMSAKVFDTYVKRLDPTRHVLTQEDMDEFEPFRFLMHRYLKKGNLGPAYEIFNRYQVRSEQRLNYILDLIPKWESKLDFDRAETMIIDEKLRKYQPNLAALYPLWKKELKNHIITMTLNNKEPQEITETLEKIYSNRLARLSQSKSQDVFQIFMNTATGCFDPHTQYYPPRLSEDFDIHMSLSLEGIGAVLQNEYEYTKVVRLIPKGPADKSHTLMPGDKIIGVGQGKKGDIKDTIGQRIDDVVKLIRGPKDSYVRLKVIPAKNTNTTTTIAIKRDKVRLEEQSAKKEVVSVSTEAGTYKLGIIEIPNFYIDFKAYHSGEKLYKSTTRDVAKLIKELQAEGIDGLIIDLRDNGGGALKEANDLVGLFIKSGPTVQIRTKYRLSRLDDQNPAIAYTGPLVVMINRMSASASEIFAGAIKDYHRGLIVGTRSFGKGTVQELKPLGKGRLKMTNAKFYRVSGQSTQHKGILPDIAYPRIYKVEETGESAYDGAMPWDRIRPTRYRAYAPLTPLFQGLAQEFTRRAETSAGMQFLKKRIALANETAAQQLISLNLDTRKKQDQALTQKELTLVNEYRSGQGQAPVDTLEAADPGPKEFKSILKQQTQYLAAYFISLSRKNGYSW